MTTPSLYLSHPTLLLKVSSKLTNNMSVRLSDCPQLGGRHHGEKGEKGEPAVIEPVSVLRSACPSICLSPCPFVCRYACLASSLVVSVSVIPPSVCQSFHPHDLTVPPRVYLHSNRCFVVSPLGE